MLPSPTYVMVRPLRSPSASLRVSRSAIAWHGWWPGLSMFTTGTDACSARPLSWSSSPVRRPMTALWRERTSAVSFTDSPRVSCISSGRRIIGWPPSSNTPDSNDVRVRVDGFWKMRATVRPSRAREDRGACLSAAARCRRRSSRSASNSAPVMKCRDAGIELERLPRSESESRRAVTARRLRRRARGVGVGRGTVAGGAALVACGVGFGVRRGLAAGPHVTQLRAGGSGALWRRATPICSRPTGADATRCSSAARCQNTVSFV